MTINPLQRQRRQSLPAIPTPRKKIQHSSSAAAHKSSKPHTVPTDNEIDAYKSKVIITSNFSSLISKLEKYMQLLQNHLQLLNDNPLIKKELEHLKEKEQQSPGLQKILQQQKNQLIGLAETQKKEMTDQEAKQIHNLKDLDNTHGMQKKILLESREVNYESITELTDKQQAALAKMLEEQEEQESALLTKQNKSLSELVEKQKTELRNIQFFQQQIEQIRKPNLGQQIKAPGPSQEILQQSQQLQTHNEISTQTNKELSKENDQPPIDFSWQTIQKDLKEYYLKSIKIEKITKEPGKAFVYSTILKIIGYVISSSFPFMSHAFFWGGSILLIDSVIILNFKDLDIVHDNVYKSFNAFINSVRKKFEITSLEKSKI